MRISAALSSVRRLYIDASPLVYYVEEHPVYIERMEAIIDHIDNTPFEAISSVITLTEVITYPLRLGRNELVQEYRRILLYGGNYRLIRVTAGIAEAAADLRARYNLRTPDALHVATALESNCDIFLTNDMGIKRVTELRILVLDELELDPPAEAN